MTAAKAGLTRVSSDRQLLPVGHGSSARALLGVRRPWSVEDGAAEPASTGRRKKKRKGQAAEARGRPESPSGARRSNHIVLLKWSER